MGPVLAEGSGCLSRGSWVYTGTPGVRSGRWPSKEVRGFGDIPGPCDALNGADLTLRSWREGGVGVAVCRSMWGSGE